MLVSVQMDNLEQIRILLSCIHGFAPETPPDDCYAEPMKRVNQKSQTKYSTRDIVKTVRGEGVIKFVFPRTRNGRITYSVNFANKRLGIIFHENELSLSARESRHV